MQKGTHMHSSSLVSSPQVDVAVIGAGGAGLATAYWLERLGLEGAVLESSDSPGGSWPAYYNSLRLFSPRRWSALPGLNFPGDQNLYPSRDEVVDYLTAYSRRLSTPILTGRRAHSVSHIQGGFEVEMANGGRVQARQIVVATGGFSTPNWPDISNASEFGGRSIHSATYRAPQSYAGQRIAVVGGGNTAIQIAVELTDYADVVLLTRKPLRYLPQTWAGRDLHDWLNITGLDHTRLLSGAGVPIIDDGRYRRAVAEGRPLVLPMFDRFDHDGLVWNSGAKRQVDTVIYATGYRPGVDFLADLSGALSAEGLPNQREGVASRVPGLYFVGLPLQKSFASATLRGFGRDAKWITQVMLKDRVKSRSAPSRD